MKESFYRCVWIGCFFAIVLHAAGMLRVGAGAKEPPLPEREEAMQRFMLSDEKNPVLLWNGWYVGPARMGRLNMSAVADAQVDPSDELSGWAKDAHVVGYRCHLFHLKQNDVLSLFGRIYQLEQVAGDQNDYTVVFKQLGNVGGTDELKVKDDSFIIPYRSYCEFYHTWIYFDRVDQKRDNPLSATVAIGAKVSFKSDPPVVEASMATQKVKVGDLFQIEGQKIVGRNGKLGKERAKYSHKVLNVVPPDENRHIIGWLELDSTLASKEEVEE